MATCFPHMSGTARASWSRWWGNETIRPILLRLLIPMHLVNMWLLIQQQVWDEAWEFISNKFPGDAGVVGSGTTLWVTRRVAWSLPPHPKPTPFPTHIQLEIEFCFQVLLGLVTFIPDFSISLIFSYLSGLGWKMCARARGWECSKALQSLGQGDTFSGFKSLRDYCVTLGKSSLPQYLYP